MVIGIIPITPWLGDTGISNGGADALHFLQLVSIPLGTLMGVGLFP